MPVRDISRSSLRFFVPGWWLEGTSWQLLELHSQLLFDSLEEGGRNQCPPRRVVGWNLGRCRKVHSVLLEGQTWTWSLGPEIAHRPRDPWNSAGSSQGGESPSKPLLETSLQTLKWKMRPKTGSSNTSWTWARSSPKSAQLDKSLIPSQLDIS